jgi:hypothetical protein
VIFISQELIDPTNEQDLFVKAMMVASTGAFYSMHILIAKTRDHQIVLRIYRNDHGSPNTPEEVAYMESLSPINLIAVFYL